MTILIFIIGISLLILIHELGHFLAAKYFGLWVEEFGIGFPPRLFKIKKGETVYSINLLPFGGFVRIHGEKRDPHVEEKNPKRSFWFLPIWKRAAIIGAGVFMNFILGWIVISGIYMVGAPSGVTITGVASDSPAVLAGLMNGDRVTGYTKTEEFIKFVNDNKGKEISFKVLRGNEEMKIKIVP